MKLIRAQVTNYRNIIDSGDVEIGSTTCLVGKNEAGKTAFLKALEGLRSVDPEFKEFEKTENYPRRYLADYQVRHDGEEAVVVSTNWEMDDKDVAALQAELGAETVTGRTVTIRKTYNTISSTWTVTLDGQKVLAALVARHNLCAEVTGGLESARNTAQAAEALEALGARTEPQNAFARSYKEVPEK